MKQTLLCAFVAGLLTMSHVWAAGLLQIPRGNFVPKIDGQLTPREIEAASTTTLSKLLSLEQPRYPTIVYLRANANALYIGFDCKDSTGTQPIADVKQENGPVTKDDCVQLLIAPALQADKNNYFDFAVNAAGTKYSRDMEFDRPVENWSAAAHQTAAGWQAEMLIPFDSIRGRFEVPYWRGNIGRNRVAHANEPGEISVWNQPGVTLHNYKKFGFFKFVNEPEPQEENIEVLLQQLLELRRAAQPEPLLPLPILSPASDVSTSMPAEND